MSAGSGAVNVILSAKYGSLDDGLFPTPVGDHLWLPPATHVSHRVAWPLSSGDGS